MSAQPPTPAQNAMTGVPQTTVALPTARLGEPVSQKAVDRPSFGTGPDVCTQLSQTVSEMPAPGNITAAEVAPPKGPIDVAPESPVVTVAKALRDSPTFKKLLLAMQLAWGAFTGYVLLNVAFAGGPFKLDNAAWIALLKDASYPALVTILGVYGITLRVSDNNPVVNGSLKKA